MSLRILLIGKNGQIGSELAELLPGLGLVVPLDRQHLDLSKPNQIRRSIENVRPHVVINAAAYTAVDQAESDPGAAHAINVDAPAVMAEAAKKIGAVLVHYSTDYVFDGLKNCPYTEHDQPNPVNAYGRTKFAGEEAIRSVGVRYLILRTGWVYATTGRNFLLTILRLASQREELRVVNDQFGAPTWCREIAKATASILKFQYGNETDESRPTERSGTYHVTASGITTWFGFAQAILDDVSCDCRWVSAATSGNPLIARRIVPISTADYPTPARRPPYSVLSNSRLVETFGIQLPDWRAQLRTASAECPALA